MGIKKCTILLFIIAADCFAQNDSLASRYYKTFNDKISVQAFALNTSNSFTLQFADEKLEVEMLPNQKTTINLGVQYDIISFSIGYAPSFLAENKDNKGSRMRSLSLSAFLGRWVQRLDFFSQKGITLKVPEGSAYLQDLKTLKIGGNTSFMFNRKFSFAATTFQNAKQLKSAGTFAAMLSYYYTEINGKDEPSMNENEYFFDIALSPAYYYNWVIAKNFLVSAGISLGGGVTVSTSGGNSDTDFMGQASVLMSLGYNSDRFYCGINNKGLVSSHAESSNVMMDDVINYGSFFVGYRFDAPSFLEREREKLKSRL